MKRLCASPAPRSSSIVLWGSALLTLGACSSPSVSRARPSILPRSSIGVAAERATEPARVPAIIDGQAVSWNELRDRTSEIGGAIALEEIALDRALTRELERAGLTLAPDAISRERALLLDELSVSGAASSSADVLSIVRRQRNLGEVGFERLLERNARLRALVTPSVQVEEREVELAMRIRHGARKLARIIVTPSEREVATLRREILGASDRLDAFTARAATRSIDASGARGGQIGSVSPNDPAFPDSLRQAIASLAPGQVSSVLAIDGGFAILIVEQELAPESTSASRRAQVEREILRRKQRLEMDRTADRLLDRVSVSVLDPSLAWSWEGRGAGG